MAQPQQSLIDALRAVSTGIEVETDGELADALRESVLGILFAHALFGPEDYVEVEALRRFASREWPAGALDSADDEVLFEWWSADVIEAFQTAILAMDDESDPRLRNFVRGTGMCFGVSDQLVPKLMGLFVRMATSDRYALLRELSLAPKYEHMARRFELLPHDVVVGDGIAALCLLVRETYPVEDRRRRGRGRGRRS